MAASAYGVLVIDSEAHTAAMLTERLAQRGHSPVACMASEEQVRERLAAARFDAMVLDFHLQRPGDLALCELAKSIDAALPVIAITSPGVAARHLREWSEGRTCIDRVIRKPLADEALFQSIEGLAAERAARERAGRYAGMIPEDAMRWADGGTDRPTLSEQAILFTDIRRSTELVSSRPLPEWFSAINRSLTDQSTVVRQSFGAVVKYTGDGLLASFRGRGRSHLALRCAVALQGLDREAPWRGALRVGIGLAEGLVMSGPIGAPGRQQFDVVGATVHLAARLCSLANEGEIVATPRLVRAAGFTGSMPPPTRQVMLRGFANPIECVSFPQLPAGTEP